MKPVAVKFFLLLSILSAWILPGCDESGKPTIFIRFPDPEDDFKGETETLWVYVIISGTPEATCSKLIDGIAYPNETNFTVKDQASISSPFTGTISSLKVPNINTGTLLFFIEGEDSNNNVRLRGCTTVEAGSGAEIWIFLLPKPIGKGMIIPAYLNLDDTANWTILNDSAATIKNGGNPTYKDFFVIVNGDQNGPFSAANDWATAASLWDPIRVNGGSIFGYVHTCEAPSGQDYRLFRSLEVVEGEITAWVSGYSNLDGIFVDEFYPRYEIAGDNDDHATYPNGPTLAPTDTSFLNQDGTFIDDNQINPTGGYYDQLTKWIRATYPKLRIIGNPGSWFYPNQLNYADLVDVIGCYEDTYDTASASDWVGITLQNISTTVGRLALIFSTTSDYIGAIDQVISHGYTHFYITDLTGADNTWGSLASYFTSEVSYIANHN